MSAEERERPRAGQQAPPSAPSVSELLASCAAAEAVSTPPERPRTGAPGAGPQMSQASPGTEPEQTPIERRRDRDAAA